MSSILKALRRLEEEKAERLDAPVDIARDILRQPRKKRPLPVGWLLVLVCTGVLVTAGGLLLWSGSGRDAKSEIISQAAAAAPSGAPMAAVPRPISPVVQAEPEIVEVQMPPQPTVSTAESEASKVVSVVRHPLDRKQPERSASKAQSPRGPQAPPINLTLSDIAFQPERESRLAIVNDLPVMEGTVIEGARVEEILSDRVRFTRAGKMFEIGLKND